MCESLKKKKQEEWSIDCSFPTDTKFSSELWVVCNRCSNEFSIRSIKRHAALIHKVLKGKVGELCTISHNQFHPKKKEKEVKRLQETTKVYCRSCNKKLSIQSIRNHALIIHKETGPVDVLSTPVKRRTWWSTLQQKCVEVSFIMSMSFSSIQIQNSLSHTSSDNCWVPSGSLVHRLILCKFPLIHFPFSNANNNEHQ